MRMLIVMALLSAGASGASAAPSTGRHLISIGAGLVEPVSKVRFAGGSADNGDLGIGLVGQYAYYVTPRLAAGVDAEYQSRSGTLSTRLYPAADARVAGDTWLMLGILRYSLRDRGTARPFVLFGAGGAWNKTTIDVRPSVWADTGTHETRRLVDDSAWVPAASARFGLDFGLEEFMPGFLTLEAGWTGLASALYGATPRGRALGVDGVAAALHMASFTARYSVRF